MESIEVGQLERETHELIGALDAVSTLREELELRLEEARDDCVREVLDNIIALVDAQGIEYRHRRDECRARLQRERERGQEKGVRTLYSVYPCDSDQSYTRVSVLPFL